MFWQSNRRYLDVAKAAFIVVGHRGTGLSFRGDSPPVASTQLAPQYVFASPYSAPLVVTRTAT